MSEMYPSSIENNDVNGAGTSCESPSSGRCSPAQQRGPGRHSTTAARRTRRKWSQEENRTVMECFYLSSPKRRGYRKRMHELWKRKGTFDITEQRLIDQKANIIKKEWLSGIELEEIRRNIEDIPHGELNDTSTEPEISACILSGNENVEKTPNNSSFPITNIESNNDFPKTIPGCTLSDEEEQMLEKIRIVMNNTRERLHPLRGMHKTKITSEVNKINSLFSKLVVSNVTEVNDLFYAGAVIVTNNLVTRRKGKEPWWKRRLENKTKELNKDLGHINSLIEKERLKYKARKRLENKYKIKQKSLTLVREEIKQRIKATTGKIKRYDNRISQYQQNRTFKNNQGQFYRDLENKGNLDDDVPNPDEAQQFWSGIWGEEHEHNRQAE